MRVRLDRCLANEDWIRLFPNYVVTHLNKNISDCVLVICDVLGAFGGAGNHNKEKVFRYEHFWSDKA